MTPLVRLIVQSTDAAIVLVAAVNVAVALEVPELAGAPTVNVVEPQPLFETVSEPRTKSGSTKSRVSPTLSATLSAKDSATDDGAAVTAFEIIMLLCLNTGVGGTTAGEVLIAVAVMSLVLAKVTAAVRVAKLEA